MILSYVWTAMAAISLLAALCFGTSAQVSAAAMEGAKSGVELTISMAGALCLWIVSYLPAEEAVTSLHPILQGGKPTCREEVKVLVQGHMLWSCGLCSCLFDSKAQTLLKKKTKNFYLYWSIGN